MLHRLHPKYLAVLALMLLASLGAINQARSAEGTPAPSIEFAGVTYHLAWNSNPTSVYIKYEYLPPDQKLPHYQNMLLLEWLTNGMTVAEAVGKQVELLRQRRIEQNDLVAQHRLLNNERTGEFLLDFLLSGHDPERGRITEWNAYRYVPHRGADGKPGVLLYGYSARAYGDDDGQAFLLDLVESRPQIIQALISASVPQPGGDTPPAGAGKAAKP